jgi:hypothetical protein
MGVRIGLAAKQPVGVIVYGKLKKLYAGLRVLEVEFGSSWLPLARSTILDRQKERR